MNEIEFEDFLHRKIPITKQMGINIIEFTPLKVRMIQNI